MKEIKDVYDRPFPLEDVKASVGKGWGKLVEDLITDLFALGWDGRLGQIKEKFGGLRFYIGGGTDAIWKRIDKAETESLSTCEKCGAPGKPRGGGWILTLCDKCEEEKK